jgi:ubiquinone/menaquinone biosynthesis C-methylase UbiE
MIKFLAFFLFLVVPAEPLMTHSISENNGLSLISARHAKIYSVGISTGGAAEIRMASSAPSRHITATTIDREGANFAKEQVEKAQLSDKIEVKLEDVSRPLPYADEHFDFVYARLVLHYLSKQELIVALKELYRVLKPQGDMFIVVRSADCLAAQKGRYNPENGMTTCTSKNGATYSRTFHTQDSLCSFLREAGFHIQHAKAYDERLCVAFQRTILSSDVDNLIEVFVSKK